VSESDKRAFRRLAERRVIIDGKLKLISKTRGEVVRLLEIPQSYSEVSSALRMHMHACSLTAAGYIMSP